ncbi:MAG: bacteriohemerythrin [Terracidiphilus sp.]|nr:bacteriohemerythrin [Terracidiphilus sp.]
MLVWQDSYSVGVNEFDEAHKKLFAYFNEFYDAMQKGRSNEKIGEILDKTFAYSKQHFESEEKWMAAHHYPDLAAHKEQHRKFRVQVESMLSDFRAGKIAMSGTVSKVLREWLVNHILQVDQLYGKFNSPKAAA